MISSQQRRASHVRRAAPRRDVNLFLRMMWRRAVNFAKHGRLLSVAEVSNVA
jgi:deferrochelatase/peroxidase EfeB